MTYSIIQKTQLEGALRLDAEYYQPEFLEIIQKIRLSDSTTIKKLADKVFSGPFGSTLKSESYQDEGIPFIRIGDIKDIFINTGSPVCISKDEHQRIFSYHLDPGDIVLSKIGTVGRLSVISEDLGQVNISENNIGIRLSRIKDYDKIFVLFYLLSKYGQKQILRNASGNIQLKLNVEDVENIILPIFTESFKRELYSKYNELIQENENSKSYYSQAEDLLLEELGLKDFGEENDLFSIVNFSDVQSADRIDAEYFQPKYQKLFEVIKKKNPKQLGDLALMTKGFEPGAEAYQEDGKQFIRVSNLTRSGLVEGNQQYLNNELYQKLKTNFEPQVNEILLSKDATPGIAYTLEESVEGIISSGILRLKAKKEINSEYLALMINSIVGQMQAERDAGGSIIAHWKPDQIKNILIPILPKKTQQKIANLVRRSHAARQKSKELLEEAKRKVEEMIEKGI